MSKVVDTLKQFNRKERYWLLDNTLNVGSMPFKDDFLSELRKIGLDVPKNTWWAMDYHLDWIAAAIIHTENTQEIYNNDHNLITGTNEDIDFVIAFDNTIILIEAKCETSWNNEQLNSKVKRLEKIFSHINTSNKINIKLVLMSQSESQNLKPEQTEWPKWMVDDQKKPLWIQLKMGTDETFKKVVGCKSIEDKTPDKKREYWTIKEVNKKY